MRIYTTDIEIAIIITCQTCEARAELNHLANSPGHRPSVESWLTSEVLAGPHKEIQVPFTLLHYVDAFTIATQYIVYTYLRVKWLTHWNKLGDINRCTTPMNLIQLNESSWSQIYFQNSGWNWTFSNFSRRFRQFFIWSIFWDFASMPFVWFRFLQ